MSVAPQVFDDEGNKLTPQESLGTLSARTSNFTSPDRNYDGKGGHFLLNVTAVTGAASIVMVVEGKLEDDGLYYEVARSSAFTTTGIKVVKIYPGILTLAGAAFSDILPHYFRMRVEHANGDSITYQPFFSVLR